MRLCEECKYKDVCIRETAIWEYKKFGKIYLKVLKVLQVEWCDGTMYRRCKYGQR